VVKRETQREEEQNMEDRERWETERSENCWLHFYYCSSLGL